MTTQHQRFGFKLAALAVVLVWGCGGSGAPGSMSFEGDTGSPSEDVHTVKVVKPDVAPAVPDTPDPVDLGSDPGAIEDSAAPDVQPDDGSLDAEDVVGDPDIEPSDSGPDGYDAGPDTATPCAPPDPDAVPVPPLVGDNHVITLEHEELSLYEGLVRARNQYSGNPMIADIVVCNGDFENPNIEVGLSGHSYYWSYKDPEDAPEEGYIVNVHSIPTNDALEAIIDMDIKVGTRVRIWGFEVLRIDYDSGSWWTDAGCNTLMITHICIDSD